MDVLTFSAVTRGRDGSLLSTLMLTHEMKIVSISLLNKSGRWKIEYSSKIFPTSMPLSVLWKMFYYERYMQTFNIEEKPNT